MLDADTLNPGKINYSIPPEFHTTSSITYNILLLLFLLSTDWNVARDLNKMAATNVAMESVSVDGVTQVQVMIMQTSNTLTLIFPGFSFYWFHSYCIEGFHVIVEYEWENEVCEQWSLSVLPA